MSVMIRRYLTLDDAIQREIIEPLEGSDVELTADQLALLASGAITAECEGSQLRFVPVEGEQLLRWAVDLLGAGA